MELRQYWAILRRYWWLIVVLPLLAALFTVVTYEEPPVTYAYQLEYSVSFLPNERDDVEQDPVLTAVQASEYITDDLTKIVPGTRFASYVQQHLPSEAGYSAPQILSSARAAKTHRILTVDFAAPTEAEARAAGEAVKLAIDQDIQAWLNEIWGVSQVRLELVNDSGPVAVGGGLRSRLDVPLRVALALVAAVALAFLLDFLDDSVRSRAEAEQIVGPVLAEIPTMKRDA